MRAYASTRIEPRLSLAHDGLRAHAYRVKPVQLVPVERNKEV